MGEKYQKTWLKNNLGVSLLVIILIQALLEILYYVTIQFAITCDYSSFATIVYHFYN